MSNGSYTVGSSSGGFFARKDWSGGNGKSKDNPYTMTKLRKTRGKSRRIDGRTGVPEPNPQYAVDYLGLRADYDSNQDLAALGKLSDKIRGHSFNAAVFAAEARESLGTISNTMRAVGSCFRSLKRGDAAGAARALGRSLGQSNMDNIGIVKRKLSIGDLSGAWLALQYGWKPLLNDCFEAAKALENMLKDRKVVYRSKVRYGRRSVESYWGVVPVYADLLAEIRYKYTLWERPGTARTLGLQNPASVIWEKIPYSFVVDWFMPIGSFLDSASFLGSLEGHFVKTVFLSGSVTDKAEKHVINARGDYWEGGFIQGHSMSLTRTVGTKLSVPAPNYKAVKDALSIGHLENAAALFWRDLRDLAFIKGRRP